MAKIDLTKLDLKGLESLLAETNAQRDALAEQAKAISAEIKGRAAMAEVQEVVGKLTPEMRDALKATL